MCLGPEMLVPALLTAGKTAFGLIADRKVRDEQEDIYNFYQARNKANQQKSMAEAAAATGKYRKDKFDKSASDAEQDRVNTLPVKAAPGQDQDYAGSAPSALKNDIARKIVESVEKGKAESRAMAKLNSYGDVLYDNQLNNRAASDLISMHSNFIEGDNSVSDFEMSQSYKAGDKYNTISDLFGVGAMGTNLYFAQNPLAMAGKNIGPTVGGPLSTIRSGLVPPSMPITPFKPIPLAR